MTALENKFRKLATDNAPGQEVRQNDSSLASLTLGEALPGIQVDFSHGDVDAFEPTPGSLERFVEGVHIGGKRAYTEYRGDSQIREKLAVRLGDFTGASIASHQQLILTPGSQGALFLAIATTTSAGDKVAIVQPDYFANRKLVEFFDGEIVPVSMDYLANDKSAGLDLSQLEDAFKAGAKVFVFSNPNNPAGVVYSAEEIAIIAQLAERYGVTVIVDQLYSRLLYSNESYTHLCAQPVIPENLITIMGPSKTESLSGYRLGVAFGSAHIINRMEKLQAIVSLRAGGYSQSVLQGWFSEPAGWMEERIRLHQAIRDDLINAFSAIDGVAIRCPQAGSYLFPRLPELRLRSEDFVRVLRHQANVIVTPGTEFSPHATQSVRLNFSQDHQAAIKAVERMATLIGRYRK
ncbi:aspartate aminotransferase [Erwinia typographi]|uniref:Aspartate aminotransferase n=1 Tax=Erwinia typographi TaxID=371042 RepID=A0A0A3Z1Y8_9GAMM|nr:pyridoxal phosphate-dependent aminotransferase [Erwinia typographi]KGT92885.1 aspartate aminotransferase [Erwinia typographi]